MRVAFVPARDGFAFVNTFVNHVQIAGVPITETRGRCGGMAFAALDYWHHRLPVPSTATLPADGVPLADYIYNRLITSMVDNWPMYFHFMRTPDHPTLINGIGVGRATREEEFPKLRALLDQGLPQPLGLTQARDIGGFAGDHQVVAYGYEVDDATSRVFIWDNRYAGREDVLEFTSVYDPADPGIHQSNGDAWRGFFVERYAPQRPWYLADGNLLSDHSDARIYVIQGGAKLPITSPEEFDRLGYRWTEVVEVPDSSMGYVADVPGDRTVLRDLDQPEVYVVYGRHGFHVPDPDTMSRLGFSAADVRVVPHGSLAALRSTPVNGTVLREESKDPVYLVDGDALRWIPDPETFAFRGLRWERVGVVPDGTLAGLPMGQPLPFEHTQSWSERSGGHLLSRDHDQIDYQVEAGLRPADEVEFVLVLGDGITWRKELVLKADDGQWTVAAHDGVRSSANGLYRYQLPNGRLTFRKAKAFGVMTDVLDLADLGQLPAGARVTFSWLRD
jgi:hypothetical protein